jgi:hypothetical protein
MHKRLFAELVQSMMKMGEVARGQRPPSGEFHVDVLGVEKLRVISTCARTTSLAKRTGLRHGTP